jgi:GPH family glycoside/pentoside/hexuronide:cation symporter
MLTPHSFLYSLANFANFLGYTTFSTFVIFFYTTHVGASPNQIGRAWFIFGIWNTLNDFLFGYFSDKLPEKGRRTLPILVAAIPTGIAFYLIWDPPLFIQKQPDWIMVGYFLIIISIYDAFQSVINISQGAALPEISDDQSHRASLASLRQFLGLIGMGISVALTPLAYEHLGWSAMGAVWGCIMSALYLVSIVGLRKLPSTKVIFQQAPSKKSNIFSLLRNSSFLIVLGYNVFIRFALACVTTVLPFYSQYVLNISSSQLSILLSLFLASAVISTLIWRHMILRFGLRASGISIMIYLGILLIPFLFINNFVWAAIVCILVGPAYGGSVIILDLLYAQIVDVDRKISRESRAGLISGIIGFAMRFSPSIAGLLLGELLTLTGFSSTLSQQSTSVLLGLRSIMSVFPLVAVFSAAGLLLAYTNDDRMQQPKPTS